MRGKRIRHVSNGDALIQVTTVVPRLPLIPSYHEPDVTGDPSDGDKAA